jgi:hypothetical protein
MCSVDNVIQITSKSEFFNTPLVYKVTEDLIILRKSLYEITKE